MKDYEPEFKEEEREPSLKEKVDLLYEAINKPEKTKNKSEKIKKIKTLKLPRRAKVRKSRMKKGYCGVIFLNENRTSRGQKVKLDGGTYQTKDENYHVTNGSELIFWEGKYPILWQRYDKANPINLFPKDGDKNEIYGQSLIKLRMKKDSISEKKKPKVNFIFIIIILVVGYFLIKTFFPQLFGS